MSVLDLLFLEGKTSHALPSLIDLDQFGVQFMGKESYEFLENESLLPFVILRVVLVRILFVLCSWGFYGQRKELVGLGEGKYKIFGVTNLLLKLWTKHIPFPYSLVLQPIIAQVFNI